MGKLQAHVEAAEPENPPMQQVPASPQSSAQDTHAPVSAQQDPSHSQTIDPPQDPMDIDESRPLSEEEKLSIVRALVNAPEGPKEFQSKLQNILPTKKKRRQLFKVGIRIEGYDIYADSPLDLTSFRDNLGADKNVHFYFGQDANPPAAHVEGMLSSYHKKAHKSATSYLKVLFDGLEKNPRLSPSPPFTGAYENTKSAIRSLESLNKELQAENKRQGKDDDTGVVRYAMLCNQWRAGFLNPQMEKLQIDMTQQLCQDFHYPKEWANLKQWRSLHAAPSPSSAGLQTPSMTNPKQQESRHAAPTSSVITQSHDNGLHLWNSTGGQTRTIAIPPRVIARSIRSGYTSSGEKIEWMQRLGFNSARFVVLDAQGMLRFVSCAAAGGQPALQGAIDAGVPTFLQDEIGIRQLRDRVRTGGNYGLFFVAISEWQTSRKTLPYVGVGFWHMDQRRNLDEVKVGLSRSALKKVVACGEGERLIAEYMTPQPSTSVKESLFTMCPDVLRPNEALALPWYERQQATLPQLPGLSAQTQKAQAEQLTQQIEQLQEQLKKLNFLQPQSLQPQFQQPQFQQPQFQQPQFQQPQFQQPQFQQPQFQQPQIQYPDSISAEEEY
ncbi:hypothetical protein N7492_002173 [Penicillium capsulatum]|uniref:Uncharacterized protein n=1 Tax=Penicillium capsulatum TaxID=69766 RepID=A0A9W9IH27_9EURO|nr:hypothetical protein N7492_002173 [Penicillium capsulatum]